MARKGYRKYPLLQDERLVKHHVPSFAIYIQERRASGDFTGIATRPTWQLIGQEWRTLPAPDKKVSHFIFHRSERNIFTNNYHRNTMISRFETGFAMPRSRKRCLAVMFRLQNPRLFKEVIGRQPARLHSLLADPTRVLIAGKEVIAANACNMGTKSFPLYKSALGRGPCGQSVYYFCTCQDPSSSFAASHPLMPGISVPCLGRLRSACLA